MQKISIQDSWLSYNPVVGCSGNCVYCFQQPRNLTNISPILRADDINLEYDEVIRYYNSYYNGLKTCNNTGCLTPIAIGTNADMFDDDNIGFLYQFLDKHVESNSHVPIVVHTKKCIPAEFANKYQSTSFPIILILSISLLPPSFEPNIASITDRLLATKKIRNIIAQLGTTNIKLIHKWQPFIMTDIFHTERDPFIYQISNIFDCSILIGLRITNAMYKQISQNKNHLLSPVIKKYLEIDPHYFNADASEILDLLPHEIFGHNSDYPVFRNTSCAISYVLKTTDYTGTIWRHDICPETICPQECQERCNAFRLNWSDSFLQKLDIKYSNHLHCIEPKEYIDYEKTIALTHLTGKPWFVPNQVQKREWFCGNYRYFSKNSS